MSATRFAVVLTHNRPELLRETVAAILPQVDVTLVIDNASDPAVEAIELGNACGATPDHAVAVIAVPDQPANLPRLWKIGMTSAHYTNASPDEPHHIAFLCDDAPPPPGWFAAVVEAMVATGAAAGCTNAFGHEHPYDLRTSPDGDLTRRMPGWAFVLDGSRGIEPDETMPWWWSDTDIDWQARAKGGMVMVGGGQALLVPNRLPNDFTGSKPELGIQAGLDRATFAAKWGQSPW